MREIPGSSKKSAASLGKLLVLAVALLATIWASRHYSAKDLVPSGSNNTTTTTEQPAPSTPPPAAEPSVPGEKSDEVGDKPPAATPAPATEINRKLMSKRLIYTKHATCRMECRKIDETDVQQVLAMGKVNLKKSDLNEQPCPKYALEAKTDAYNKVLVVFAYCADVTKVITCYPVGVEDPATCSLCK